MECLLYLVMKVWIYDFVTFVYEKGKFEIDLKTD